MINYLSQITRLVIIGILFAGFSAHLAVPFFGDAKKTAFTQWLNNKVISTGEASEFELRDQIKKLPDQASNFWMLVQDASQLISNNEDEFRIGPLSSSEEDQKVSNWLIGHWSFFNSHNSSKDSVIPEFRSFVQKWMLQQSSGQKSDLIPVKSDTQFAEYSIYISLKTFYNCFLAPLISGISINAP